MGVTFMLRDCEFYFPFLVRPNAKWNKTNPTYEIQIRTSDIKTKKDWESKGVTLKPYVNEEEGKIEYYYTWLKKRSVAKGGTKADPPEIVDGNLEAISGACLGNGSRGNVLVFQYEYPSGDTGAMKHANVLSKIQVTNLIKFVPKERVDFDQENMTVIEPDVPATSTGDDVPF